MSRTLTPETFGKLLSSLDSDRELAGSKYEQLRHVLIRFFEWRGARFPDEHADETFDRVSRKLGEHVPITNIGAYCYEVARLVWLEALKRPDHASVSLESTGVPPPVAHTPYTDAAAEARFACLEECLRRLPRESRDLILEYYRDGKRTRIDRRKALAERFGLQREALANRAQRVRDTLERCVTECLGKSRAI
jgi:DNA-directed RNA polymerase specialized sigma24 family protein